TERGGEAGAGRLRGVALTPGGALELVDELDVRAGAVHVHDAAQADHLARLAQLDRPQAEPVAALAVHHARDAGRALVPRARLAVGADVAHDLGVAVDAVGAVDVRLAQLSDQEPLGFDWKGAQPAVPPAAAANGGWPHA